MDNVGTRFKTLRLVGIISALLLPTGALALTYGQARFVDGRPISAAQLNGYFDDIQSQVGALEQRQAFTGCTWQIVRTPGPSIEVNCPANTRPVSGGCDGTDTLQDNCPNSSGTQPNSGASLTGFDQWFCRAGSGMVNAAFALCCPAR
jgi:hypothetical protein